MSGYRLRLEAPDGTTRDIDADFRDVSIELSHTQSSRWDVTVPHDASLEDVVSPTTEAYIYVTKPDGTEDFLLRGNATGADTDNDVNTSTTTINGWDTTYLLRQGAGEKTYSNIRVENAIQDYWDTQTPFDATVVPQNPSEIVDNDIAYSLTSTSDFAGRTSIPDTTPLTATNNQLQLEQSAFTTEGEDATVTQTNITDPANISDYSGGETFYLSRGPTASGGPDKAEVTFSLAYTMPASAFTTQLRYQTADPDGAPEFRVELDHDNGSTYTLGENTNLGFIRSSLGWSDLFTDGYSGPDLTPGDYTLRVVGTDSNGTADNYYAWIDVIAPYDARYSYTFDNDNGGNSGYLNGPELYPDAVTGAFNTFDQSLNVTSVDITSTWTDTSGTQALAASNDGGGTFLTASNSSTLTQSFSTVGSTLDVEATFSRHGSRTTATPKQGYLGQQLDDIAVRYSANNLSVLDSFTVDSDDFTNLQNLHRQGDYQFTMDYSESDLLVESYPQGEVEKSLDVVVESSRRRLQTDDYYNRVVARSRLGGSGSRTTVTVTAPQSEVDKYGVVERVFINDKLDTEAGLESLARTRLREGVRGDELRGTLSIHPEYVQPGYEYSVDALGGERMTLESVSYSEGAGVSLDGQLQFAEEPGVVPALAAVDATLGDVRDAN